MRTLFLLHEQYNHYKIEPAYTEVYLPMIHSGLIKTHEILIYQRKLREIKKYYYKYKLNNIKKNIKEEPIVIYGAGTHTSNILDDLVELNFNIVAISDSNIALHGKKKFGYEIIAPKDIINYSKHIIVSSQAFEEEIISSLNKLYSNDINIYGLYSNLKERVSSYLENHILKNVNKYKPDFIVHTPTWPHENISKNTFMKIKQKYPYTKIFTIWWDYDERLNSDYCEFEKDSLIYSDFIAENTSFTRIEKIKNKKDVYKDYEFGEKVYWLPTLFDPFVYKKQKLKKEIDIAIFGSAEGTRKKWIDYLSASFPNNFKNIGSLIDKTLSISKNDYVKKINQTKIFINTQTYDWREQLKGKIREALMCGVFILEEDNAQTRAFIPEGKGIIYFNSKTDLKEKIEFYLENEKEREKIALEGYEWFKQNYSSKKWTKEILKELRLLKDEE